MYTHIRPIAYEVPTVLTNGVSAISGWDAGEECQEVADIIVQRVDNQDLYRRLLRMANVVNIAYDFYTTNFNGANAETDTLKVFLMPEFYFRPPEITPVTVSVSPKTDLPCKAYSIGTFKQLKTAMEKIFSNKKFNDWYFICGTVLFADPPKVQDRFVVRNVAICIKGGGNEVCYVEKRMASNLDGVIDELNPGIQLGAVATRIPFDVQRNRIISKYGIAIEICLDHVTKVLKKTILQWRDGFTGSFRSVPQVKLHVLTAGGMPCQNASIATQQTRYFFRNDGDFRVAPANASEFKVINSYNIGSYPPELDAVAMTGNIAVDGTFDLSTLPPDQHVIVPCPPGMAYTPPDNLQRVAVYKRRCYI